MVTVGRISHYELLEPIGRDGLAEIYRARDTRLEREVVVRLLRAEEMSRPDGVERFRREARLASTVTHPHVCAVHDSGEDNGRPFLVTELLEGRALDEMIAASAQPLERVIEIGIQLADALIAAHRRGIVHGNIKPSNIFITTDGYAKLLELGAAAADAVPLPAGSCRPDSWTTSAVGPEVTTVSAGEFFHPYVSPEQIAGVMDYRSDIFSVGAVLYEMVTGKAPFRGGTPRELATAIATETPPRPRTVNPAAPKAIEDVIERALQKDRGLRYQGAEELREHLRRARCALDTRALRPSRWRFNDRVTQAAVGMAVLVLLVTLGAARSWWRGNVHSEVQRSAILLSQIANGTGDPDFDGTLRQAIAVYLGQSPYLDLASDERITATLRLMGRDPAAGLPHNVAAEVCQRLGLQAMLEGSVSAVGRATAIALVASDCSTGAPIAREQVEVEKKEDVLRALGRLTGAIRQSLGESGTTRARHDVPIEEATTPSMAALKAYTQAVARRTAGDESEAVALLERAVTIDPHFALAYTTLSSIFGGFGETSRSEQYARLAFENRSRVSERERLFIMYQYHDRITGDQLKAREALEVWNATYPRDYRPANALAVLLNRTGEYQQAIAQATEAMRRNPAHAFPRSNLAYAYRGAGQFAQARVVIEEALRRKLETMPMRRLLYQLAELQGDTATAQQQIAWAADQPRRFDMTGARAQVAAFQGRMTEARRLYAETVATATARGFRQVASGYESQAALAEALYGNRQNAISGARDVLKAAAAYEPELRAATALALAGAPDEAEAVVRRLRTLRPEDTFLQHVYVPVARAAVWLARGNVDSADEELRASSTYERGTVAALAPVYLRAMASLESGANADAARIFKALLDARGADPFSPLVPFAALGLARAEARIGDYQESRRRYDELLRGWSSADPDLPILVQARRESRTVESHPSGTNP